MIVNCTYFLLKHSAKQCRLYQHNFCWQTKHHVASPLPPKRHNDIILEKIVWRRPLTLSFISRPSHCQVPGISVGTLLLEAVFAQQGTTNKISSVFMLCKILQQAHSKTNHTTKWEQRKQETLSMMPWFLA